MNLQPLFNFGLFVIMGAFVSLCAYITVRFGLKRAGRGDLLLSYALIFIAITTVITAATGFLGKLEPGTVTVVLALLFLAHLAASFNMISQKNMLEKVFRAEIESPNVAWGTLILLTVCLAGGLSAGIRYIPLEHDVMTYHLFFPAKWIQQQAISIIPTVFGDMAPAYAPSNASLMHVFFALPFHADRFSRVGQFPYLILAALAVYMLARRLGADKNSATIPATAAALTPLVLRQGFSAEADLAMGAAFVAALYYLDCYRKDTSWQNALLFGVGSGLCIGSKYIGVTFCLFLLAPFFLWLFVKAVRSKGILALLHLPILLIAAFTTGGFWYLRNWIVTGNPLFPLDIPPFFDGIYNKEAMLKSAFHIPDAGFIPLVWINAYGPWMALAAGIGLLIATILIIKRKIPGFYAYVTLLPLLIACVHFLIIPYNSQYRFLMPAVLLSYLPFALAMKAGRFRWPLTAFLFLLMLCSIFGVGSSLQISKLIPIPVLIPVRHVILVWCIFAALLGIFIILRKAKVAFLIRLTLMFIAVFLILHYLMPLFSPKSGQIVSIRPNPSANYPTKAWAFFKYKAAPCSVAYAGNNIPYHLLGDRWENMVFHVNIDGEFDEAIHGFFRRCKEKGDCPDPSKTDKPAHLWRNGDRAKWLNNIHKSKAGFLFVTTMNVSESYTYKSDPEKYPLERGWADELPDIFRLVAADKEFRIYLISAKALDGYMNSENLQVPKM